MFSLDVTSRAVAKHNLSLFKGDKFCELFFIIKSASWPLKLFRWTGAWVASKTGDKGFGDKIKVYLKEKLSALLEHISEPDLSIQEYIRFKIKLEEQDDIFESALAYPEILAQEKDVFFIIALDEFQDLIEWGEPFLKNSGQ